MFGFPYLDTLKLLRRPELSVGADFYVHADQQSGEYDALQRSLAIDALQGIFFESPSNPLLKLPEVPIGARVSRLTAWWQVGRLSQMAAEHQVPLVMDDTVGFGHWRHLDGAEQVFEAKASPQLHSRCSRSILPFDSPVIDRESNSKFVASCGAKFEQICCQLSY